MNKRIHLALAFASLFVLCHCKSTSTKTPEGAYQAFAAALRRGDTTEAYAALSQATRRAVEVRSKELVAASQGLLKDEPALMIFQSGTRPLPPSQVTVVEQSDTTAVLEVAGARVRMIREDGTRWAVDLAHLYTQDR